MPLDDPDLGRLYVSFSVESLIDRSVGSPLIGTEHFTDYLSAWGAAHDACAGNALWAIIFRVEKRVFADGECFTRSIEMQTIRANLMDRYKKSYESHNWMKEGF